MNKNFAVLIAAAVAVAGCGGGGGGNSASTAPAPSPAPTVSLTVSQPKISLGSSANITWTSTNATSCAASGGWGGTQAVSGTALQTPTAAGVSSYTLTCTGAGGSVNQTVSLTVPIPVQKSSYLNAKNTGLPSQSLPKSSGANPVKFISPTEMIATGYAMGDFFQDGTASMVGFTNNFVPASDPNYGRTPGHAYFYKKDANGNWIDQTSKLLSDQTGCITPRKVIVADFNGDGVPDIFVACHGTDLYPLPAGYTAGEVPRILLSQPDGTYKNVPAPVSCYCHGAAAADVNGNGFADIVVVDPEINKQPCYLVNNKDGTFKPDYTRMPPSTAPNTACNPACRLGIYSVELVDFDATGKFDLWLGGVDDKSLGGFASTIFHNPGTNNFATAAATVLPSATAPSAADNNPLDLVYTNGNIYLMRVNSGYTETSIQKINYKTLSSTMIYQHGPYAGSTYSWLTWMLPYQSNIIGADSSYGVSIPQ
ncbi:MAG: hypothetical protein NVS3B3_03350 [Aquirhabdus sp.]